jgi:hypothetical protein
MDAGADGGRVDVDYHVSEITERFRTVISRSRDD